MTQIPPPIESQFASPLPYATPSRESDDVQLLNLLSIFHFIVGPLAMLMGTIPVIHLILGIVMVRGGFDPMQNGNGPDTRMMGWIFIVMGSVFILIGWSIGALTIYAGLQLRRRQKRIFCMVVAGILCAFLPFGTVLGVFTLVVLSRPSVRSLYGG